MSDIDMNDGETLFPPNELDCEQEKSALKTRLYTKESSAMVLTMQM